MNRSPLLTRSIPQRLFPLCALAVAAQALAQAPAPGLHSPSETTLPPVLVKDRDPVRPQAGGMTTRGVNLGVLGAADALDTPFSVVGFTAQTMAHQQAGTAAEVLANDPSVRVSVSPGGLLDAFYIRGFPVNEGNLGEFGFDGVFGVAPNYRVLSDYVERVELIKGPTALVNGMAPNGAIGGSVNIVPKRAGHADLTRAGVGYRSSRQLESSLDLSRRFGEDRALGVRLNAGVQGGETQLDHQERQAAVGALALDYRASHWRTTLDLIAQREDLDAPSRPVFLGAGVTPVPAAPDARRNLSQGWEFSRVEDQSALWRVESDLTERIVAFADIGAARTSVDRLFGNPTLTTAAGDATWTPARFSFEIDRQTANVGARIKAVTGPLHHAISVQASTYRDRLARGSRNGTPVTSNLYTAPTLAAQTVAPPDVVAKVSASRLDGLALADTLSWQAASVQATLGARLQQVRSDNYGPNGAVAQSYDEDAISPFVGLVFRSSETTAVYANYTEGLSRGDIAPTTAGNAGTALAPYRAKQLEAGGKWQAGGLLTTLAVFQITKPNGQTSGPNNIFAADGEQRHRGIELGTTGAAMPSLRLMAAVTVLDAKVTQSSNAAVAGKHPIGVPALQANATADWDVPGVQGVAINGTVAYAGKQYADAGNVRRLDAWTRLDAGVRWEGRLDGRAAALRLGVRNLLDSNDWVGASSFGGLAQAAPRSLHLSGTMDF
ncbi:MAG: TonB-dependent receptor [Rhizobacter sp.]